jgi:hypothetical protein
VRPASADGRFGWEADIDQAPKGRRSVIDAGARDCELHDMIIRTVGSCDLTGLSQDKSAAVIAGRAEALAAEMVKRRWGWAFGRNANTEVRQCLAGCPI